MISFLYSCGKTTVCQLFAALASQKLHAVNCHLHTETSDFLGGLRPVRHHADETVSTPFNLLDTSTRVFTSWGLWEMCVKAKSNCFQSRGQETVL